jgi:hypothetical protein
MWKAVCVPGCLNTIAPSPVTHTTGLLRRPRSTWWQQINGNSGREIHKIENKCPRYEATSPASFVTRERVCFPTVCSSTELIIGKYFVRLSTEYVTCYPHCAKATVEMVPWNRPAFTIHHRRVYPEFSRLAAWSEKCKWYSSLPLDAVVSPFVSQSSEFCRHKPLCCFSTSVYCCSIRHRPSPEIFGYTLVWCHCEYLSSTFNLLRSNISWNYGNKSCICWFIIPDGASV